MTSDNAIPRQAADDPAVGRDATRVYFQDGTAFGDRQARPSTAVTAHRVWDDDQLDAAEIAVATGAEVRPDTLRALCIRYIDRARLDRVHALEFQAATDRAVAAERRAREAELRLAAARRLADDRRERLAAVLRDLESCQIARGLAEGLYAAELANTNRVAVLHAEVSAQLAFVTHQRDQAQCERTLALHRLAGTTPVSIQIALDRAARAITGSDAKEQGAALERQVQQHPDDRFDNSGDDDTEVGDVDQIALHGGVQ